VNAPREWRLEQEENSRKLAINWRSEEYRVDPLRRKSTEQDCYGQGIHFETEWAQKLAHLKIWRIFGCSISL
jgi:hypothetical protein